MIPPRQNAEFVACMEDVLELYQRPYNPQIPVVCMDEKPVQLVRETRQPWPARPGRRRRYDYEYERAGTACLFMFTEALGGWRQVSIRERRTAIDWAEELREVLNHKYARAEKVILVCDNLNTHKLASFYEAFAPTQARQLAQRLEIHYTPRHGSWLNIAECELSVLTRQCLWERTADSADLGHKVYPWAKERNRRQRGVDWQFTTADARIKWKRLYPHIKVS